MSAVIVPTWRLAIGATSVLYFAISEPPRRDDPGCFGPRQ
jgi:hypothetical protein